MDSFDFDRNNERRGRNPRSPQWNPRPNPPRPEPPRPPRPPRPEPPRPPRPEPPRPPRPPRPEPPRPPRPTPPPPRPPRPTPPPRPVPIPIPLPVPQPVNNITVRNAVITEVTILPTASFVTIVYEVIVPFNRVSIETVRLVITQDTLILNQLNQQISVWGLRRGMRVNATFSSAMTSSIPPQSVASFIRVLSFS